MAPLVSSLVQIVEMGLPGTHDASTEDDIAMEGGKGVSRYMLATG